MGKSRPYITNSFTPFTESTRQAVETGKITQGHARQLVALSERQQAGSKNPRKGYQRTTVRNNTIL